jgi:hypothetical protein
MQQSPGQVNRGKLLGQARVILEGLCGFVPAILKTSPSPGSRDWSTPSMGGAHGPEPHPGWGAIRPRRQCWGVPGGRGRLVS